MRVQTGSLIGRSWKRTMETKRGLGSSVPVTDTGGEWIPEDRIKYRNKLNKKSIACKKNREKQRFFPPFARKNGFVQLPGEVRKMALPRFRLGFPALAEFVFDPAKVKGWSPTCNQDAILFKDQFQILQ